MRPAIERPILTSALDVMIVKLTHRWGTHQGVKRHGWQFAVVVVRAVQAYDHVRLRLVITNALNECATRRVGAGE